MISLNEYKLALRYPRLAAMIESYVGGNRGVARRFLRKAAAGEELYIKIAREAFARRHNTKGGTR